MAARRTRFKYGLKNPTLYNTITLDSSATFGGTTRFTTAEVDAFVYGVASGDTSRTELKMATGHLPVTGSEQVQTGLTQVLSASANVENMNGRDGSLTPWIATCRVPKPAGKAPANSKGSGYITIKVLTSNASTEAAVAASVDWMAMGT